MNHNDNSSCQRFQPYEGQMSLENYLLSIFFIITSLTGIIGNTTVIYIILFKPSMRTVPNLLIFNLSLGDMVFILGHLSFSVPSQLLRSFYGGIAVCRLIVLVKLTTLGVSIFTLTFMAIDRFRAITRPLHQHTHSKVSVIIIMIVIWIFSMAISLPFSIMTFVQTLILKSNDTCLVLRLCSSEHEYFGVTTWMRFCLYFVIPFFVISFCYIGISKTLCSSQNHPSLIQNNNMDLSRSNNHRRQMKARRKLSVVVLALVGMFVICRLPYESHSINLFLRKESIQEWSSAATVMLYLYSFINPLILCILSPTFRQLMLKMWCRCTQCSSNPEPSCAIPISSTQVIYNRSSRMPPP